jgi:hypothetical protein
MNYTIRLDPSVALKKVDGQTVLFSKRTGDFYGLNPTAVHLIERLLESDLDSTTKSAANDFGVEEKTIRDDITEVVDSLVEAKLVHRMPIEAGA